MGHLVEKEVHLCYAALIECKLYLANLFLLSPELQAELDLRNDQITDLQKQIFSADQDKEKEGGSNWWDSSVSTLTEARIALQVSFRLFLLKA